MPRVDGSTFKPFLGSTRISGLRIHMIGIGGCGMSGAAAILLRSGAKVTGSDISAFDALAELEREGAQIFVGHRAAQLDPRTELVVISAAIPVNNVELVAAREFGIPVVKYAELLGILMKSFEGVAVSGTHGKTTTTALCTHLFRACGLDPSFVVGARCEQLGGHSGVGSGRHFIVESCEFDRSFLHFHPTSAAILNIEADHLDCYRDVEDIGEAFAEFAQRVSPDGLVVCNGDDVRSVRAARRSRARVETFGFTEGVDWRGVNLRADQGRYSFDAVYRGRSVLSTALSIPGQHNVANTLAAIALAHHAGADWATLAVAASTFRGVDRRLSFRGEGNGVTILDDYAHHPTEVRVTIDAARKRYEPRRALVVFQPHQYSRTWHLMEDFAESFFQADEVVIPEVYGAREAPDGASGRASEELALRIARKGGHAQYVATLRDAAEEVSQRAAEGDLVLTMGAGDVWKVADELVERFCGRNGMRRTAWPSHVVSAGGSGTVCVPAA